MVTHVSGIPDERKQLLAFIDAQRGGLRRSLLGLSEEQARSKPSASDLTPGGLVKHVAETELGWLRLAQQRTNELERDEETWAEGFTLTEGESVADVLAFWTDVANQVEEFLVTVPSLDDTVPLPDEPWYPDGEQVSMRWIALHLVEEIGRHAGHADIIRESLDGKSAWGLLAEETGESWG